MTEMELRSAIEILPDRLYYVSLKTRPSEETTRIGHFFSIDQELIYWNFFLDFGPLNLAQLYRFCQRLNSKLKADNLKDKIIYYYSSSHAHKRANAAFLICAWSLLYLDRTPEEAFRPFRNVYPPLPTFHDASPCICTFNLTIMDCLKGLAKARHYRFFDFSNFDAEEYEHFEQVENGDLNWIIQNKFLAFAGPHNTRELSPEGYYTLTPESYGPYFLKHNVSLVVRLNKKYYNEQKFKDIGINHLELYYLDGSVPTPRILQSFLESCESTAGAIAVHCKAGLGRTGTCIGCYMMKHYRFTAAEAIGWIRLCRPGSIIGPQQHYMKEVEQRMWQEGDLYREKQSATCPVNHLPRREGLRSSMGSTSPLTHVPAISSATAKTPLPPSKRSTSTSNVTGIRHSSVNEAKSGTAVSKLDRELGHINLTAPVTASGELQQRANLTSRTPAGPAATHYPKLNRSNTNTSSITSAYLSNQGDSLLHRRAMMAAEHRRTGSDASIASTGSRK